MKKSGSNRQTTKSKPAKKPKTQEAVQTDLNRPVEIDEIENEFREAQRFAKGSKAIRHKIIQEVNSDSEPALSGNDPDANWVEAGTSGDESVVGGNPTPDQSDVDMIGIAVGLEYEDNEPLHTTEKVTERDRHRWELDPASSEDYKSRVKKQGQ
jgi:hypothetical protein